VILGVGIDLERVDRFAPADPEHERGLHERVFTAAELAYCRGMQRPAPSLAARFAAKEALFKALGTGKQSDMSWHDVEVVHEELGRPALVLAGRTKEIADRMGVARIHVSITHTRESAAAVVVLES